MEFVTQHLHFWHGIYQTNTSSYILSLNWSHALFLLGPLQVIGTHPQISTQQSLGETAFSVSCRACYRYAAWDHSRLQSWVKMKYIYRGEGQGCGEGYFIILDSLPLGCVAAQLAPPVLCIKLFPVQCKKSLLYRLTIPSSHQVLHLSGSTKVWICSSYAPTNTHDSSEHNMRDVGLYNEYSTVFVHIELIPPFTNCYALSCQVFFFSHQAPGGTNQIVAVS